MQVVGYLNPNIYFPALLVTVVRDDRNYFAAFPTSKMHRLSDVHSINDLKTISTFIPEHSFRRFQTSSSYAFGISRDNIISGSPAAVRLELKRLIATEQLKPRDKATDFQEAILEFLGNSPKYLSLQNLKNLSEDLPNFLVLTTTRKLKGKEEIAHSFLIQLQNKGVTKTLYRKGIPAGATIDSVPAPSTVLDFALS